MPYSQNLEIKTSNRASTSRFAVQASTSDVKNLQAASTPVNTRKNTQWGINAWDEWGRWRNDSAVANGLKESTPFVLVPPLTVDISSAELNFWMCRFVMEVRRKDRGEYPAESLRQLCIAIWRYLRDVCRRYDLNFFDKKKPDFADFRECLDAQMKKMDATFPASKKQAEPVTEMEEDILWNNVFSKNDATCLQYAIYFYACKLFGLRAADEHIDLSAEQFSFGSDDIGQFLRFTGRKSKTVQGGIFHKKVAPKDIKQYRDEKNPRCVVSLFRRYLSLIPAEGSLYRRPLASNRNGGDLKYSIQNVGLHTIQKFMTKMCEMAGIQGYKTGHSGKVTTATSLYRKGFDEQLIADRTGHTSDAIRAYKRSSDEQAKAVSDALQPPKPASATSTYCVDSSDSNEIKMSSGHMGSSSDIAITKGDLSVNIRF